MQCFEVFGKVFTKVNSVTIGFALPSTMGKINVKRTRATKRSTYYNITKQKEGRKAE